jgi:hypothetical protein
MFQLLDDFSIRVVVTKNLFNNDGAFRFCGLRGQFFIDLMQELNVGDYLSKD